MRNRLVRPLLLAGAALLSAAPAAAQQPSTNVTVNLIQLLIKNKVITREAGDALLAQAEAEAAQARAALAQQAAPAAGAAAAATATAQAALPPPAPGTVRVPYVPESVRQAMTDEIRQEVLAQAEFEGWARPNQVPGWTKKITVFGDLRFRSQSNFYADNNALGLIDFNTFNDDSPIDINPNTNPTGFPILDTRTDRSYLRIRARLGVAANITDNVYASIRIASGNDDSPISTNQTLGGGWAKKDIWLDQALLRVSPTKQLAFTVGRFPNPFLSTELLFDDDLNLDGVIGEYTFRPGGSANTKAGLIAGAFPFGYISYDFPTYADQKSSGFNKWMFAGEGKVSTLVNDRYDLVGSAAFYAFDNVQGQLSAPCALYNGNTQCSTDPLQPVFLQKGNTLFLMRNILPDPANPLNYAQPQLLGLSLDYQVLQLQAKARAPINGDVGVEVQGTYINNVAFDASDVCRYAPLGLPINNVTLAPPFPGAPANSPQADYYANPCTPDVWVDPSGKTLTRIATYDGGNQGWMVRALVGYTKPRLRGQWNFELGYRYLESDAILDSLPDSDFHLGGTNYKGYLLGGRFALYDNLVLSAKWMSANEIIGPPLAIDVLQIDLMASF